MIIIKIIIIFIIYIIGVILSTILDAILTKGVPEDRGEYDQYFSLLSWAAIFLGCMLYLIDYIYNKFHK